MTKTAYQNLLKKMLLIRNFENALGELYKLGKIRGVLHLSNGQEAIPVALCNNLEKDDILTGTHRAHHLMVAKGLELGPLFAELAGKVNGFCAGHGGSMHNFSREHGFWGANGIVGANIAISAGIAFSLKEKKSNAIVVNFLGDGSTTQGIFHESLNMAALMELPIIYICENNLYAQTTAVANHSAARDLAAKVQVGYNINSIKLDGNNLLELNEELPKIIDSVRHSKKPYFVEVMTYRQCGHSTHDLIQEYKSKDESTKWYEKDPIQMYKTYLEDNGLLNIREFEEIKQEVFDELSNSISYIK